MKKLTKEQAIAYFNEKAPKSIRDNGIKTIEEYGFRKPEDKEERNFFLINGIYMVRYIIPEAYNHFMRNQNFDPKLSGLRCSKNAISEMLGYWKKKGWLKEVR